MAQPHVVSKDLIQYLAKVCDWLDSCPDGKHDYGEYYPGKFPVYFDSEVVAVFVNDDPDWLVELA